MQCHMLRSPIQSIQKTTTKQQTYPKVACAGEVVAVFVKGQCHNAVRRVERLLHAISVMDVNVNVQHSSERPETRARKGVVVVRMRLLDVLEHRGS